MSPATVAVALDAYTPVLAIGGASAHGFQRSLVALAIVLVVCLVTTAAAQFGRQFRGYGPRGYPAKFAKPDDFGRGFNFCRAVYTSGRREAGGQGWSTDYPDAELNFSIRLSELTKTRVTKDHQGSPEHVVVRLTEEALYQCPYLHMEDVGTAAFTEAEVLGLREYLLKGGFLWADDFWGVRAWVNWASQIAKALPAGEFPPVDVPLTHELFRILYDVRQIPIVDDEGSPNQFFIGIGGAGMSALSAAAVARLLRTFHTL